LLGRHREEKRVLPKLGVVQSARTFEATVNPGGQIVLTFTFVFRCHGQQVAGENCR